MKILFFGLISAILLSGLSACGWLSEKSDRVAAGSLTLTPLVYPEGLLVPQQSKTALNIPETIDPKDMTVVDNDPAPPPLDVAKANAEIKILQPTETKKQKKARLTLSSELKQTPDGHQFLIISGGYDRIWAGMADIVAELGLSVEDLNRTKQYYSVYRNIEKTAVQEREEKETGVIRELGNRENYQIYIDSKDASHTLVSIRNQAGQDDDSGLARHLLVQIKAALEQPIK